MLLSFEFNLYRYNKEALRKRMEAVYSLDRCAAVRKSHENPAIVVGLYKLNPVYPWLESAWFQPLIL